MSTTRSKIIALHKRLAAVQRDLLLQAADADTLPTDRALANIENALASIEATIEEQEAGS